MPCVIVMCCFIPFDVFMDILIARYAIGFHSFSIIIAIICATVQLYRYKSPKQASVIDPCFTVCLLISATTGYLFSIGKHV